MDDAELSKSVEYDQSELAVECRRLILEKCQWEKACKDLERDARKWIDGAKFYRSLAEDIARAFNQFRRYYEYTPKANGIRPEDQEEKLKSNYIAMLKASREIFPEQACKENK